MSFSTTLQEKIMPVVMKFINLKPVQALKGGMLYIMPLTIVGSIFLLFAEFPWAPVKEFFANSGLAPAMYQANNATMGIFALVVSISIPYSYAKNEGLEPLSAGVLGLVAFILTIPQNIAVQGMADPVGGVLPTSWIGSKGVVGAIILGILVGIIYTWFLKRDIRIKLPDSVPEGVANSFNALIPAFAVTLFASIIYGVALSAGTSFLQIIYDVLQTPLQGMTEGIGMVIIQPFVVSLLWWFGIHGATVVGSVVEPITRANLAVNAELLKAGNLSFENGAYALTKTNWDNFGALTGSGFTIGIVVFMLFFAKSSQFKTLGKLAIGPAIFNINEPIIFGVPIVMNPILLVPFILVPVISYMGSYLLINAGILEIARGLEAPWTTPPIIMGLIAGGPGWAIYQAAAIVMSFFVYLPFIKRVDDEAYKQELSGAEA